MENIRKICIIGGGNMGGAIAGGIARNPDFAKGNLTVTARTAATLEKIACTIPGIRTSMDNRSAAEGADLVIIAVKPWQAEDVIREIRTALDYGKSTVASVVAGIPFQELERMFRKETAGSGCGRDCPGLLRIIPNTAAALGKSTTFIARHNVAEPIYEDTVSLFSGMGEVIGVREEMMAAGTSLASCGIAFALRYLDASIKGGTRIGFGENEARRIVINTMKGALALLETNGTMPQQEIDKVTTPGGYTSRGLEAMEAAGFSDAVIAGLENSL